MITLLATCGGFLLAVLWMDLIFDVQVLRRARNAPLPESVLASIAGYYRRATTDSQPMSRLIALVMGAVVILSVIALFRGGPLTLRVLSLALCLAPASLAFARVVPNAVRLGKRSDDVAKQSELARAICRDHLICFASIGAFTLLQVARVVF